jgi:hypothetical protein
MASGSLSESTDTFEKMLQDSSDSVRGDPPAVEDGEELEEEEEEEEFEVKLTDETETKTIQPQVQKQHISLQPASAVTKDNDHTITSKFLVPTPSQSKDNLYTMTTNEIEFANLAPEERPWNKPGADITDYFNYGFNEESWNAYCKKQQKKRVEQSHQEKIGVYEAPTEEYVEFPPELKRNINSDSYAEVDVYEVGWIFSQISRGLLLFLSITLIP